MDDPFCILSQITSIKIYLEHTKNILRICDVSISTQEPDKP